MICALLKVFLSNHLQCTSANKQIKMKRIDWSNGCLFWPRKKPQWKYTLCRNYRANVTSRMIKISVVSNFVLLWNFPDMLLLMRRVNTHWDFPFFFFPSLLSCLLSLATKTGQHFCPGFVGFWGFLLLLLFICLYLFPWGLY